MRVCFLWIMALCLCLVSCERGSKEVERIGNMPYKVISDSIYSRMPGRIFYQNNILYWHDAIASENIIHVLDVETGNEIASFGDIGMGPKEFTQPILSLSSTNGLFLTDFEKGIEALVQINNSDEEPLKSIYHSCDKNTMVTDLLHVSDDEILSFNPDSNKPFTLKADGTVKFQDGSYPIHEEIANSFDVFQGAIAYNPQKAYLVYSTYKFPYTAIYKLKENGLSLLKELKSDIDYSIVEKELRLDKGTPKGLMDLGLTDKYIVMLQRDVEVEGETPKPKSPRDMSTLPRSLFVYDYDLNLKKVINMPFPLLRVCGDLQTNMVYAISINPEYEVISINLE